MKIRYFIHLLLFLAMCFSQISANAHVVGHLFTATSPAVHVDAHGNEHYHGHLNLAASDADNSLNDCAIYHAYAGMSGLPPVNCEVVSTRFRQLLSARSQSLIVVTESAETQPIRGPPLHA